jgi:hypothetical protein
MLACHASYNTSVVPAATYHASQHMNVDIAQHNYNYSYVDLCTFHSLHAHSTEPPLSAICHNSTSNCSGSYQWPKNRHAQLAEARSLTKPVKQMLKHTARR